MNGEPGPPRAFSLDMKLKCGNPRGWNFIMWKSPGVEFHFLIAGETPGSGENARGGPGSPFI